MIAAALCAGGNGVHADGADPGGCGTVILPDAYQQLIMRAGRVTPLPEDSSPAPDYVVPITFHVVRQSNGAGGINEALLGAGITLANMIYANAGMSFCQVGPVLYVDSDFYYWQASTNSDILNLFLIGRVPDTVNVYLLPFLTTEQGALCGLATYTTYPNGGVAMRYSCMGSGGSGTAFPHELGHYFDLLHTHEGLQCTSGTNCQNNGDLVCDTPPDPQLGLHNIVQGCVYVGNEADPCGSSTPYAPLTDNIMSYSPPSCRIALTPGQLQRARTTLIEERPELALPQCPIFTGPSADLTRVSITAQGMQGNGHSTRPAISADGRYVVFASQATNLDPRDTNPGQDIYIHDRLTGATELVSVSLSNGPGNGASDRPSISGDGQFIVFESTATNLVSGTTIPFKHVYLRDRQTSQTILISVGLSGEPGNSESDRGVISRDGSAVIFGSHATNLVASDANGHSDVFVRDLAAGQSALVSVSSTGEQGNDTSPGFDTRIDLSADGRWIVFASSATNLVASDVNRAFQDVYLRDRIAAITELVGLNSAGEQADFGSTNPSISADGRWVAFASQASNLATDPNGLFADVFLRDRQTGQTTLVGVDTMGQQFNQGADFPTISADGRRIAFQRALNFTFPTSNDMYMRDLVSGDLLRLNPSIDGLGSGLGTKFAAMSDAGNVVVYQSDAINLVESDTNGKTDVFAFALPGIPVAVGDVNADGVVNIDDLLAVITAWGPCPASRGCPADITGNGHVNIDDLLAVITNWG